MVAYCGKRRKSPLSKKISWNQIKYVQENFTELLVKMVREKFDFTEHLRKSGKSFPQFPHRVYLADYYFTIFVQLYK